MNGNKESGVNIEWEYLLVGLLDRVKWKSPRDMNREARSIESAPLWSGRKK